MFRKMTSSLTGRMVVLTAIGTAIALITTAIAVLWIFERSIDSQLDNHLLAYNDIVAGAIHVRDGKAIIEEDNPFLQSIPRYWQINHENRQFTLIAKSPHLKKTIPTTKIDPLKPQRLYFKSDDGEQIIFLRSVYDFPGADRPVVISFGLEEKIAEAYKSQLRDEFGKHIYPVLAIVSAVLIMTGLIIILMVTRPLHQVSYALKQVQNGKKDRIEGMFPDEITALSNQINQLLNYTSAVIQRHRTFSSNVAHALRTPLTVIRNETQSQIIRNKVDAMLQVIERNLTRAHTSGGTNILAAKTNIKPVADRIAEEFGKVYKKTIEVDCANNAIFHGDEVDLYEILGNLIENACKFSQSKVRVTADRHWIIVEDDGPGIPESEHANVLARGARLDETKPGSGIGLAVTQEIISLYGGELNLGKSDLGGLKVKIRLS